MIHEIHDRDFSSLPKQTSFMNVKMTTSYTESKAPLVHTISVGHTLCFAKHHTALLTSSIDEDAMCLFGQNHMHQGEGTPKVYHSMKSSTI